MSVFRLVSVTRSLLILFLISILVVGILLSESDSVLNWICVFVFSILSVFGDYGITSLFIRCAFSFYSLFGLLNVILRSCRRSVLNGSGAVWSVRFSVSFFSRMVSIWRGSVSCRLFSVMSIFLVIRVAGWLLRLNVTFFSTIWDGAEKRWFIVSKVRW